MRFSTVAVAATGILGYAQAHGDHAHQAAPEVAADASWAEKHMAGETTFTP